MAKKISKKYSSIGENIRRIRKAKNISQAKFAELFNLGRPAVGAYEEGRSEPKIETIIQIAKIFSISIDNLLTKHLTVSEIYSMDRVNKKLNVVHARGESRAVPPLVFLVQKDHFLDYIIRHRDTEFIRSLPQISTPDSLKNARVFEMKGYDMENQGQGISPEDLLFCEKIIPKKTRELVGEILLAVTTDEIFCKRLCKIQSDSIIFSSDATGVQNLEKRIEEIQEVWHVRGVYSKNLKELPKIEDRMTQLEEMIKKFEK